MRYKHLRILFHAEAVMAAKILSFLSVPGSSSAHASQRKKMSCFSFLYIFIPLSWEPCLTYIWDVFVIMLNVKLLTVSFFLSISSQKIPLKGRKNHVLFQGSQPTVNIAKNLGCLCNPSRSSSQSYMPFGDATECRMYGKEVSVQFRQD